MALDDGTFETLAEQTLAAIMDAVDASLGDVLDVDYQDGVLTIETDDGGCFVVNRHLPNRQIWLSSPVSGAAHFAYDEATGRWPSTRGGADLHDRLAAELAAAAGVPFSLDAA